MGQISVHLDRAALCDVAERFERTADLLDDAVRLGLAGLLFDGTVAGRVHVAAGTALRRALDGWGAELARWSRASAEIAAALRRGAADYGTADSAAADRVG